jgi:hypothetical protein
MILCDLNYYVSRMAPSRNPQTGAERCEPKEGRNHEHWGKEHKSSDNRNKRELTKRELAVEGVKKIV